MPERQDGNHEVTQGTTGGAFDVSRRRVLALTGAAIAGGAAATGSAAANERTTTQEPEGTDVNQGPLGGGEGYDRTVSRDAADVVVETREELGNALDSASSGDVVYVAGGASIDVESGEFTVPAGVTLASNRGVDDSPGGLLYTDEETKVLNVHADARVTGLRVQGPYFDYFDPSWYATGTGLEILEDGVEVDNCEVWGFARAAIDVEGDAHVHHSYVHHNPRDGLGYGVVASGGHPTIEWNYFNYNRHSLASTGGHHGYTCRYNHFGPDAVGIAIDIHAPGGVHSEVHNNIVQSTETVDLAPDKHDPLQAIQVRGVPDEGFEIRDNWFFNPLEPRDSPAGGWTDEAIIQPTETAWKNVTYENNHYGRDADVEPADVIPGYGN